MILFLLAQQLAAAATSTEVWVRAETAEERATLRSLPVGFAEGQDEHWWRMHADDKGLNALRAAGLQTHFRPRLLPGDAFLEPDEMVAALEELADAHTDRAELVELGWSVSSRPIVGLRITGTGNPTRRVRILGAHHGDETSSAEVALQAARTLLESDSPTVNDILSNTEVWVVPHVNPDGVASRSRYNDRDVDLNRNFGFEWSETEYRPGSHPFSEPETRVIRALGSAIPFGAGLSVHAGATNLGWTWNYTEVRTSIEDLLASVADGYAESCHTPGFWLTNGADWYITNGDTTDWSYGRHGTLDYTLEVSHNKSPGAGDMESVIDQHDDAVIAWMNWPLWITGTVIDGETGLGVPATIDIEVGGQTLQAGPTGEFSRPVEAEVLMVEVNASGYLPSTHELSASGEPATILLFPRATAAARPVNRVLSRTNVFQLDIDADEVALSRPGEPRVVATVTTEGWSVPPHLQAGAWDLTIDEEEAPRALFITEEDGTVEIDASRIDADTIELSGSGFGRGSRVWAYWGEHRSPVAVQVLSETTMNLLLDGSDLPLEEEEVDLLIWTVGEQVPVTDIAHMSGDGETDEPDVPSDSGDPPDESTPPSEEGGRGTDITGVNAELKPGGCSSVPRYPGRFALVTLFALICFRREWCEKY